MKLKSKGAVITADAVGGVRAVKVEREKRFDVLVAGDNHNRPPSVMGAKSSF